MEQNIIKEYIKNWHEKNISLFSFDERIRHRRSWIYFSESNDSILPLKANHTYIINNRSHGDMDICRIKIHINENEVVDSISYLPPKEYIWYTIRLSCWRPQVADYAYDGSGGHHGSDGTESQEKGTAKSRKKAKDLYLMTILLPLQGAYMAVICYPGGFQDGTITCSIWETCPGLTSHCPFGALSY